MPIVPNVSSVNIFDEAEHELAAFLHAASDVVGAGELMRAGEIWMQAMKDLDCPVSNFDKFFRRVTLRAAAQLAEQAAGWSCRGFLPSVNRQGITLQ